MAAIDTLLATQQGPDFLGAVNRGVQVSNLQELQKLKLSQAQQQAPVQNKLLQNRLQQQAQSLSQNQRQAPLQQQILGQRVSLNEQKLSAEETRTDEQRFNRLIVKASNLIGDVEDRTEFENLINSATFLDNEAKDIALQFGPNGIRRAANQVTGRRNVNDSIQSSKINDDGSVTIVRRNSGVEIIPVSEVDAEVLQQARDFDVETKQRKSQATVLGKDAAKFADESIKAVTNINKNIRNLREVIKIVEVDGADTGPLAKRLPNITAAANKLENVAGRLGLDVVNSVTFGALSAGELALARDIGLPQGLQGPELVQWAKERINAQEKLANYLNRAAQFTSISGNTVADFIAQEQQDKSLRDQQQPEQLFQPSAQSNFIPQAPSPTKIGRFEIEIIQ